jgi:hypothetical protein
VAAVADAALLLLQPVQPHGYNGAGANGRNQQTKAFHFGPDQALTWPLDLFSCAMMLQVEYKYQITVDGISHSWDGSYWKLTSGSRVFWLLSDPTINTPLWLPWYYPLLIPNQHYTTVHAANLEAAVWAAMSNDAESRQMGADAYNFMKCNVNLKSAVKYLELVVRSVQVWYADEHAVV